MNKFNQVYSIQVAQKDNPAPYRCIFGMVYFLREATIATNEVSGFLYISSDSIFMDPIPGFTKMREKSFDFTNYQSI